MDIKTSPVPFEFVWGDLQSLTITPKRLTEINSWHGHIPFAFWLMKKLEPSIFVELGVHKGDSYSAFCQAVQTFSHPTACYGVDTWQGDDHASFYDDTIYREYSSYHDENYSGFSRLIRSTFDDALRYFADGSIDILHIDGRHGYEDVKHDFESWRPKLSDRAVVLFHDTNVREREFGVWKFFLELSQQYLGRSFSFLHSHGLGVLIVGDDAPTVLQRLGHLEGEDAAFVRLAFSTFGKFVKAQATESTLRSEVERLEAALREAVCAAENYMEQIKAGEMERRKIAENYMEQIKAGETERRKIEVEAYKAEFQLSSRLLEASREKDILMQEKDILMRLRSMRLTKPLRDLINVARRLRR